MRKIFFNLAKSEDYQLDTTTDSSILDPESNFQIPDIEPVELVNDYESFLGIEILWSDLREWI